jgi:hypothetical protein
VTMKLCKDCRWAELRVNGQPDDEFAWRCNHSSSVRPSDLNPVTGVAPPDRQNFSCWLVRGLSRGVDRDWCGPAGRFWEPIGFGAP